MAGDKIRLGVIGANANRGWASVAHLPAIVASPDYELTAVCTTRRESAKESARRYGARLAFHDHRDLLACPDIDAVAMVVRVTNHYQLTMDAIQAGKHVYTEWPLAKNLVEAQEMADLARAKGVRAMVGMQARGSPCLRYMKELVETGYIGEVMSCHVSLIRGGILHSTSNGSWQRDPALGASTLARACGHTSDALRFVVGDFSHVSAVVSTQARQWLETDTQQLVDVTSPDNILISGRLINGGVASVHVAYIPWAGSGLRIEIYGREGTLVATGNDAPQIKQLRLQEAQAGDSQLQDMEIPACYVDVTEETPRAEPLNVGQMYHLFAQAIRSGEDCRPSFDTAVEVYRFLNAVQESSDQGREVKVSLV